MELLRTYPIICVAPVFNRWNTCVLRVGVAGLCLSLGAVAFLAGCAAPQRTFRPAQDPATLDDVPFLHYLATVPVVTVDEGMRAVLLLTDTTIKRATFDQRFKVLRRFGAVKTAWHLRSGQVLNKGTLAHMLRTLCDLPYSVNERLALATGLGDRRYALKTCVYGGLLPYGLPHDPVAGGEMLSALTEAERYLESKSRNAP